MSRIMWEQISLGPKNNCAAMDSRFDPYHKWLGIPPREQPPNHYRLLGIQLFESDPDVITAAAERQMAYLHQINTGPHLSASQRILTEVAAAKVCLLDVKKKARYDLKLKSKPPLPEQSPGTIERHSSVSTKPDPVPQPQRLGHQLGGRAATPAWRVTAKKLLIPAAVSALVLVVWGVVVSRIPSDSMPPKSTNDTRQKQTTAVQPNFAEREIKRRLAEKAAAEKRKADRLAQVAAAAEREARRLAKSEATEREAESDVVEKVASEKREAEPLADVAAALDAKRLVAESVRTLNGHTGVVFCVAFSPDGQRLVTGSDDRTVKIWNASTSQELLTLKGKGTINSVAYSPDGRQLATGGSNTIVRVWDASTGQELLSLRGHTGILGSVAYSPDGRRLASGGGDNTMRVWDTSTGRELLTLKRLNNSYYKKTLVPVAFGPDGQRLATGSWDNTIRVWDASTGQELLTLYGHARTIASLAFSSDGRRLASASSDKTVRVWDASTGQELRTLKGHTERVKSVVFSRDGRWLASGGWDGVKVWEASTGQELLTLKGKGTVNSVAYSPDGRELATGGGDGTVKVWDLSPLLKLWGVEQQPLAENAAAGKLESETLDDDESTSTETTTSATKQSSP